jgi:hypothetical protein
MAKDIRWPSLAQLSEEFCKWHDDPRQRALREEMKRWADSPHVRALADELRRLAERWRRLQELSEQDAPPPQPKTRRRRGRGSSLTTAEIARLRAAYRAMKPGRKRASIYNELRRQLGRQVSDRTLQRHVIRPMSR